MLILIALLTVWTFGVIAVLSLCLAAKLGDTPQKEHAPGEPPLTLGAVGGFDFSLN